MVFFVRITVNQSHLRPICKSTKFNPKIQRTIYSINFQRLRLHVLDFIRTVVIHFNKKELIFEDCGETISFSVLKDFLINRYNSLDDNLAKSVLIGLTKQSKNIKDLIG